MRELILNFHGVGEPPVRTDLTEFKYWLAEKIFYSLLDGICQEIGDIASKPLLTFDDGNASDARIALPALASRGLRAKFFVCAGRIGKPNYLDEVAIADLLAAGMEIGSHGMSHIDWRRATAGELDDEISGAKRRLEDICDRQIDEVAIPFGSYDRRVIARLRAEKLKCAYTSDGGYACTDAWLKPRNSLDTNSRYDNVVADIQRRDSLLARLRRETSILYKTMR